MNNSFRIAVRRFICAVENKYRQFTFFVKWALCVAATVFVWGGAVWFGSLAWDQKQGAVLALMGFCAWLVVCRFIFAVLWYLSLEVISRFFRYINYRYL